MKMIAKVLKTIRNATKQYDVPADHAFSRQSMEKHMAASAAESAKRPVVAVADEKAARRALAEYAALARDPHAS